MATNERSAAGPRSLPARILRGIGSPAVMWTACIVAGAVFVVQREAGDGALSAGSGS